MQAEPISPEVLAKLTAWKVAVEAAFPAYSFSINESGECLECRLDIGGNRRIYVEIEEQIDADGDPGWIEVQAAIWDKERCLFPTRPSGKPSYQGFDPRDPCRALRVALGSLARAAGPEITVPGVIP